MKHPRMLDMQIISGQEQAEREYDDPIECRGLTGKAWFKRKARSKIARTSRKRNRK